MKAPDLATRIRNRANKIRGDHAEAVVAHHLRRMGFLCVVRLETGWRVKRKGKAIIGAQPMAKVTGDFRAILPWASGRSVLVEVKRRPKALRYSDFQLHSRLALTSHDQAGGLSLVAWVSSSGVAIFAWKLFAQGLAMSWEVAEAESGRVARDISEKATEMREWNKTSHPVPESGSTPPTGLESRPDGHGPDPFPFQ